MKERSIEEIKSKIADGAAVVMTAQELADLAIKGKSVEFEDVDVITTATKGLMSGTTCIMAFRLGPPKSFTKVREVYMNDIPCYVGPCPNETLGLVDLIIHATDHSLSDHNYGAGHLLRELVEGKKVKVHAVTVEGFRIEKEITIDDIYFAQMMGIRQGFRNYNAFINPSNKEVKSIFTVTGMEPNSTEATICGTGVVNPLENDPGMDIIGVGTPILLNGAVGYVIGAGTRATPQRPNLMTIAPLAEMIPEYMGGYVTSNGPEVITSIGIAIPIINEKVLNNFKKIDKNVPLNVVDIVGREVLTTVDYGEVWNNNFIISFDRRYCEICEFKDDCPVIKYCPTNAFKVGIGMDRTLCFNCGTCKKVCPKGAFKLNLGTLTINGKKIPITLRQSDRNGAIRMMNLVRQKVLSGELPLSLPVNKPVIYEEKLEQERDIPKTKEEK